MNQNVELDQWRLLWQARADGPNAADLRDRIEREARRRKAALVLPVMVTILIGGWMTTQAVTNTTVEDIVFAIETWLFIAVTWAGALWIDRGTWQPLGETTSAFVEISIRRCRSAIDGMRLGACLYVGQLAVMLALKRSLLAIGWLELLTAWPVIAIGWIGLPVFLVASTWFVRRKRAELGRLLKMRGQLAGD
jgi:hypothetical protein